MAFKRQYEGLFTRCRDRFVGVCTRFLTILLFSAAGLAALNGSASSNTLAISTSDLWENATVTSDSGVCCGSSTDNLFGSGETLFRDGLPKGTVHFVEWQTSSPVTLMSFLLAAGHDQPSSNPPRDANYRGFSYFELFAKVGGVFQSIFSFDTSMHNLYGDNVAPPNGILETDIEKRFLFLGVNLLPITSDMFRAEFTQFGDVASNASGPRVFELDGYDSYYEAVSAPVPLPAALPLFAGGLGLLGLFGWRRKPMAAA